MCLCDLVTQERDGGHTSKHRATRHSIDLCCHWILDWLPSQHRCLTVISSTNVENKRYLDSQPFVLGNECSFYLRGVVIWWNWSLKKIQWDYIRKMVLLFLSPTIFIIWRQEQECHQEHACTKSLISSHLDAGLVITDSSCTRVYFSHSC